MNERNLVAISIKHTEWRWKFGKPCTLWGRRTKDGEKRSFSGYTTYPNDAEAYSLQDWQHNIVPWIKTDEPVHMNADLCKQYKRYDTVLVPLDEYIDYCKHALLPLSKSAIEKG